MANAANRNTCNQIFDKFGNPIRTGPATRLQAANSANSGNTLNHPELQALLRASMAAEENTSAPQPKTVGARVSFVSDFPNCSISRVQMPPNELPPMPKSWETAIQCTVKEFQKASETFHRSQALVDKLVSLEEDDKVIQSLMVKVPGLEASDPYSTPTLRYGLEDITIHSQKECHTFYIHHE